MRITNVHANNHKHTKMCLYSTCNYCDARVDKINHNNYCWQVPVALVQILLFGDLLSANIIIRIIVLILKHLSPSLFPLSLFYLSLSLPPSLFPLSLSSISLSLSLPFPPLTVKSSERLFSCSCCKLFLTVPNNSLAISLPKCSSSSSFSSKMMSSRSVLTSCSRSELV